MGLRLLIREGGRVHIDNGEDAGVVTVERIGDDIVELKFSFPKHVTIDRPSVRRERIERIKKLGQR